VSPPSISTVIVYDTQRDCNATNVQNLVRVLKVQQMEHVICKEDLWELWHEDPVVKGKPAVDSGPRTGTMVTLFLLVSYLATLLGEYRCYCMLLRTGTDRALLDVDGPVGEHCPLLQLWKESIVGCQGEDDDDGSTLYSDNSSTEANLGGEDLRLGDELDAP